MRTIHQAPTVYVNESYDPFVTDDFGALVPTTYEQLSTFLNDRFTSIPAALEHYSIASAPIPAII